MRWLDERPPPSDIWFTVAMYLICAAAVFGLIWALTGPAKNPQPVTISQPIGHGE